MSQPISLKDAERKAFRATLNDGLWDIMLGAFFLMWALAPTLSESLGDFWSSFVFLPFWGLVYLAIRLLRKHVVVPRIGRAHIGRTRKGRLARLSIVMVVINVVALILGIVAALSTGGVPGQTMSIVLGLFMLVVLSLAAYSLDLGRLYLYGLLAGLAPAVGEWLWTRGQVAHHGYPLVFGVTAGVITLVGLVVFVRLLRDNPLPEELPAGEA